MTANLDSHRRSWRRMALRLSALVVVPYVLVAGMFIGFQRSLLYPALKTGPLPAAEFEVPGFVLADVTTTTADGLTLHGWEATADDAEPAAQRTLVLIFHGNGGHRARSLNAAEIFCDLGADVLLFDYRGYGENAGYPSETGLAADARAMWNFATQQRGVRHDRIVLYGASLGGGVAVALAAELCNEGTPPGGLIVRSTFNSMIDAASHHYPWLPIRLALLDRYDSLSRIDEVDCPFLSLHGDTDEVVPLTLGRKLFDAAPARSASGVEKRFVVLAGAGHNNVLSMTPDAFRSSVAGFLSRLVPDDSRDQQRRSKSASSTPR